MIGTIIISVFILILILFVYIEYKNEKKYQKERRQKRQNVKKEEEKPAVRKPKKVPSAKEVEEKKRLEEKNIAITLADYPKFDHSRLLDMGLSQEEAKEFVEELIPQIETQIPLIRKAMENSDFHTMEQLTHGLKGSSSSVGTGGISDLLADYNTYLKTGTERAISEAYLEQLNHYYEELKEQYS